ncbi:hypothetical protein PF005_g9009 [Phytophthora fragariae]|uniref:Fe2OG dioxygenase domain-containing protein n=1 Tax=Phytophthora fragariae TaxID=53985 RepID=A0A6A3YCZ6_9STRA|nr:hypothetical protein PF009_g9993 [Phytophthora fragariae]KAE9118988.1 hypothetical protein PF007_g8728 [Phytophthora fragariae]KAE9216571.1 hypothetical protein PF005_g9009 [Phytophthora fragariae]
MVKGYTVLHSLSKRLQKRPRKEIQRMFKEERDSFHPVFRDAGVEDAFRLQAPLCHRLGEELKAELDPFFKSYFPEASVRDVVVLWSKPGEGDQTAHRDYSTPNTDGYNVSDYTQLPGSLLVCLNERIRVLAFGWNRLATDVNEAAMVTLEPGEIMIWRGDFIHAGTGYAENNVRATATSIRPTTTTPKITPRSRLWSSRSRTRRLASDAECPTAPTLEASEQRLSNTKHETWFSIAAEGVFGGKVSHAGEIVYGKASVMVHDGKGLFKGMVPEIKAIRYHSLVGDGSFTCRGSSA